MMRSYNRGAAALLLAAAVTACLYPDDRSTELQVELADIPTLFLKDSVQLQARLLDGTGIPVSNAVIRYATSDPTVLNVDAAGRLLAVGVGSAVVTATAVEFSGAPPATRTAQVRGLLEVDSVVPGAAFFGQLLDIYGVGLFPDSLFAVSVGGVQAQIFDFQALDPDQPMRLGLLRAWVPPPAARRSQLSILGFKGGLLHSDSLTVVQRDVLEPNDTVPAVLGNIPLGFRNPALAFEVRGRNETTAAADWYRFTNAAPQDRTIIVASAMVGAETFQVFVTDSLFWSTVARTFGIGSASWSIGPQSYACGGLTMTAAGEPFNPPEVPFPFTLLALADLPADDYDVIVPYVTSGEPAAYEFVIFPGYLSVRAKDVAEENDYCDVAKDISVTAGQVLTIDNFHDREWFRFNLAAPTLVNFSVKATELDADLDLYIIQDFRPDSLPLVDFSTDVGDPTKQLLLPAGQYFLLIVDFAGVPTDYTVTSTFTAPPVLAPSAAVSSPAAGAARHKPGAAAPLIPRLEPLPRTVP